MKLDKGNLDSISFLTWIQHGSPSKVQKCFNPWKPILYLYIEHFEWDVNVYIFHIISEDYYHNIMKSEYII